MGDLLPFGEGGLQVHDFAGLAGAAFAEGEVHDVQGQPSLLGVDGVETQAAARHGDIAPLVANVVVEGTLGELELRVVERLEEGAGGAGNGPGPVGCALYACHACPRRLWRIRPHGTAGGDGCYER